MYSITYTTDFVISSWRSPFRMRRMVACSNLTALADRRIGFDFTFRIELVKFRYRLTARTFSLYDVSCEDLTMMGLLTVCFPFSTVLVRIIDTLPSVLFHYPWAVYEQFK